MKILMVGGGTGGSVTPLIAIAQYLKHENPQVELVWFGTYRGPEKNLVLAADIKFIPIFSGKLRRYFSWQNFFDLFFILFGFIQSLVYLIKLKPDLLISAGSFVAVPTGLAAFILRCPQVIHQQDIITGLANKILSSLAKKITITFPEQANNFSAKKVVLSGNPIRENILYGNRSKAIQLLSLEENLPTILVIGGGTGAVKLNQIIQGALPELLQFSQIIHITGKNKKVPALALKDFSTRYHQFDFILNEMPDILAVADLVITRAGMGFLTELAALGKSTVIIPIPDSHQEANANFFCQQHAAICLSQNNISSQTLISDLKELIADQASLNFLGNNIKRLYQPTASKIISECLINLYNEKHNKK